VTHAAGSPVLVLFVGARELRIPLPHHGSIVVGSENLELAPSDDVSPVHLRVQADRDGMLALRCVSSRGLYVLEGGAWRAAEGVSLRRLPLSVRLGHRVVAEFVRVEAADALSGGISRTFQKNDNTDIVASLDGGLDGATLRLAVSAPDGRSRTEHLGSRVDVMVTARLLHGASVGQPADLAPCLLWVPLLDPRSGQPLHFRALQPRGGGADFPLVLPHGARVVETAPAWRRVRDTFRERHLLACAARLERLARAIGAAPGFAVVGAGRHHHHALRFAGRLSVSPAIAASLLGDGPAGSLAAPAPSAMVPTR